MNQIRDRAQRSRAPLFPSGDPSGHPSRYPLACRCPAVRRLRHCRRWQRSRLRPRDCRCRRRHWRRSGHRRRRVATLAAIAARLVVELFAAVSAMAPDAAPRIGVPAVPLEVRAGSDRPDVAGCPVAAAPPVAVAAPPSPPLPPGHTLQSRPAPPAVATPPAPPLAPLSDGAPVTAPGESRCIRRRPTPPAPLLSNGAAPVGTRRGNRRCPSPSRHRRLRRSRAPP